MQSPYEIKKEICEMGRRVYENGFVAANDGNISVKVSDNESYCTPTGVSKGFMTPDMIIKIDANGNKLEGKLNPSSEIKMHLRVYRERPDVRAVVHAHPPVATAFTVAGIPLNQYILPEAVLSLGDVPTCEYGTPSTEEIPDAVSKHLQYFDAVLLENHGALAYSDSLLNAYHKMESVEFYAQLLFLSRQLGGPKELSDAQVKRLYEIRRQFGLPGKHPANLCPNAKEGKASCHGCGGNCTCGNGGNAEADLVAEITKRVLESMGK